ncbi:malto-oligosyltrehalose synthase [Pedobacter duraquae]|uniref:4-alpha-glucanotransferase n=1 Tax=Pedobacter duraquae TaxID=425511 RepID=A0A4R6IRB5_9SPHI|nr:malto-oligosyltrehalose synthase [Pedobacter duraquae]TDO24787.1 4-alpha-glucanotransferase/malto-oligosyltrehalose synthase,TIGR02401 [Pedobacter duraquae]
MHKPTSTYRVQFHKDFTFKDFKEIIPYLSDLGIQTIYASPIFEASPGSMHGYDTVNPHRINPEIGTEQELKTIAVLLKDRGMGWIQDIVPNHMAYHQNNSWLMDVLEKGPASNYVKYFDINWADKNFEPVMAPFLGDGVDEVINREELRVIDQDGAFKLDYRGTLWPLNVESRNEIGRSKGLEAVNQDKHFLKELVSKQFYRLCSWQETDYKINYRRFFTVNSLICLNMQHEEVFAHYHAYIFDLLGQGIFQGLRIDHIDGLYDPGVYLQRLRDAVGEDTYIVVEKILEDGEVLPANWPIQGTTGYEFLATVNNLFTNGDAEADFSAFYQKISPDKQDIAGQIYEKKRAFLENHMGGELRNLCTLFYELKLDDVGSSENPEPEDLKKVLGEFLVHCPIYRFYGMHFPLKGGQKKELEGIFDLLEHLDNLDNLSIRVLHELLLKKDVTDEQAFQDKITKFFKRCMQFSGPLMAKGVEDTLMYTYNRFIGNNEVGDSPDGFGITGAEFHDRMLDRQKNWPLSLNASATHDTKRGEDVRARLNVLTDCSKRWIKLIKSGKKQNKKFKIKGQPDANDEYLIYQTLSGSLPMPGEEEPDYQLRISAYLEKALREAKRKTTWAEPAENYEKAAQQFAASLLSTTEPFHHKFTDFQRELSDYGIINSLAQLVLKFTCPGVPDVYQGTELWDLSLVDPDNRRPVDYTLRNTWLKALRADGVSLRELWEERYNGKIKLWLQSQLLKLRKEQEFTQASYLPLKVRGKYKDHILAFARIYQREWTVVIVPLQLAAISKVKQHGLQDLDWKNTRVILPDDAPEAWTSCLCKQNGKQHKGLLISEVFVDLPIAILNLKHPGGNRSAGILMHLTALPSAFGIGDMGPEALSFIDFLAASHQKYWQLLPLNPITAEQSFSPYSSVSSMAGNEMLISPELLLDDELLSAEDLAPFKNSVIADIDYAAAYRSKTQLLKIAYRNFIDQGANAPLLPAYRHFIEDEADWLDDFALFTVLKKSNPDGDWITWPEPVRKRDLEALLKLQQNQADEIAEVKWIQFVFFKQWKHLKEYGSINGVALFGDLPFYVSYDSADVWAKPKLFKLDESGNKLGLAGVPPDYFNASGQLWGMPVYNWKEMQQTGYNWWIKRLRKNFELYDLLRLDHFRAFSAFWEVPEGSENAVNGVWVQGPASDFFKTMLAEFGTLPFVAEDLGEIDAPVYALRDEFKMPGMKILQFAFGSDMPYSIHIPHQYETENCVVYTGTHDNNTLLGWYTTEANEKDKKNISAYLGHKVKADTVNDELIRMAYASNARIVIIPLQDILRLDGRARINVPSSTDKNWIWRMQQDALKKSHQQWLGKLAKRYGRI